jgi:hypothetical protein
MILPAGITIQKKLEKSIYIKKHLCKLLKTKITAV